MVTEVGGYSGNHLIICTACDNLNLYSLKSNQEKLVPTKPFNEGNNGGRATKESSLYRMDRK